MSRKRRKCFTRITRRRFSLFAKRRGDGETGRRGDFFKTKKSNIRREKIDIIAIREMTGRRGDGVIFFKQKKSNIRRRGKALHELKRIKAKFTNVGAYCIRHLKRRSLTQSYTEVTTELHRVLRKKKRVIKNNLLY